MKIAKILCLMYCVSVFDLLSARPSIKVCFPGAQSLLSKVVDLINGEKKRITFAQYTLLHPEVIAALNKAAHRGVKISGVVDQNTIEHIGKHILLRDKQARDSAALLRFLKYNNIDIYAKHGHIMHNKIMCFSHNAQTRGPVVVGGSANFTNSGLNGVYDPALKKDSSHNFENLLIIQGHRQLYEQYKNEVHRIKMEVKRLRRKGLSKDEKK